MKFEDFTYFYPEKPVLITKEQSLFQTLSTSPSWVAEKKYNGNRLCLHYFNGEFQFWNRHGAKFSKFYPDEKLLKELKALPLQGYCIFDGELRNNKIHEIKQKIMLFDVIMWDNQLMTSPFSHRRNILEKMIPVDGDPLGIPYQFKSDFSKAFDLVTPDEEIEGLVIKNIAGKLKVSRKINQPSSWMFKVRKPNNSYSF